MPNPFLSRERVHTWSEAIGAQSESHGSAITRLLKDHRRLSHWVEENVASLQGMSGGVAMYMVGVILRMYDLAGGRLRKATWDDVRAAEKRIGAVAGELLPVDDGFPARARAVDRKQPHILDEALYALFVREPEEGSEEAEQQLDDLEAFKVYMLMWVATEVLDENWQPPKGFEGEATYTYAPVDGEAKAEG